MPCNSNIILPCVSSNIVIIKCWRIVRGSQWKVASHKESARWIGFIKPVGCNPCANRIPTVCASAVMDHASCHSDAEKTWGGVVGNGTRGSGDDFCVAILNFIWVSSFACGWHSLSSWPGGILHSSGKLFLPFRYRAASHPRWNEIPRPICHRTPLRTVPPPAPCHG